MTILLTGGAGFIGANFIYFQLKNHPEDRIVCLDALTYAGNLSTLEEALKNPNFAFYKVNICDRAAVYEIFEKEQPDAVVNFAAESHVDRSIDWFFIPVNRVLVLHVFNMEIADIRIVMQKAHCLLKRDGVRRPDIHNDSNHIFISGDLRLIDQALMALQKFQKQPSEILVILHADLKLLLSKRIGSDLELVQRELEDQQRKRQCQPDPVHAGADAHADCRSRPHAGGRSQPADRVPALLEDNTGTKE